MMRCEHNKRKWEEGCETCNLSSECEIYRAVADCHAIFPALKEKLEQYRKFFKTCANVDYTAAMEGLTPKEHEELCKDAGVEMSKPGYIPIIHTKCGKVAFQIWLGANANTPFTPEYVRRPDGSPVEDGDPIMCYSCKGPVALLGEGIDFETHTIG